VAGSGIDPNLLEALVFVESAGRPDVAAGGDPASATGLTQILPATGSTMLGLHVDVPKSRALTQAIAGARSGGASATVIAGLTRRRAVVDQRFDPAHALAATVRYLELGRSRFGRQDLAFVSYHMGMGNLDNVLRAYAGGPPPAGLRYAQVYFDSSPVSHVTAWRKLYALGDDSSNYLWKIHAAEQIMHLFRTDPAALVRTAQAQTAKNSAEEVLHPAATTPAFTTPQELKHAYDDGDIEALPVDTRVTGLRIDPRMGALAKKVGAAPSLYRGLRPEALALALYIGAQVRAADGDPGSSLTVTSTVRDQRYQQQLIKVNIQATRNFSLHTTGWAFDVLRRYRSPRQALAFQAVLDRLTSLNLIAWVREPEAIHITVSADAAALKPLLDRVR
jgi:hypothetical protein